MKKRFLPLLFLALAAMAVNGCSSNEKSLQNGYYSAVAASPNETGWKDFITLYVYNNRIVTVEYNARNASGLILSWDVFAIRKLKKGPRLHPNLVIREYTQELLDKQDPERIRKIPGDAHFYDTFIKLATAAIERAKAGNRSVAEVTLTENTATWQ